MEICYRLWVESPYRIEFNENAVVWEEGEPTLRALLKQRYRIGIGQVLMRRKYGLIYETGRRPLHIRNLYWGARDKAMLLADTLARTLTIGWNTRNRVLVYDAWVRWLMNTSQSLGRFFGPYMIRKSRIRLEPVDLCAQRQFVESWQKDPRVPNGPVLRAPH